MYKCDDCGHIFEDGEEKIMHENMGECHGTPAWETYAVCPICDGTFSVAEPCKVCGSFENEGKEYCKACVQDIRKRVNVFLEKEFNKEEKELFEELYGDGGCWCDNQ